MAARYYVLVKDHDGAEVGRIYSDQPGFKSLYFTNIENGVGQLRFEIGGDHELVDAFSLLDAQIEVWRRNQDWGIDWYLEWEGFAITPEQDASAKGQPFFTVYGVSYLDLAARVDISYYAGTAYTDKSGPGETVIKAFIDENIGPGASSADRLYDTSMPGLSIEADAARGGNFDGARAWQDLLPAMQVIAQQTGLAFDIVGTGPATFEFRVYEGQRGDDRSNIGVDPNTGLNAAGNVPVIFSETFDNIVTPHVSLARGSVVNIAHALGPGENAARQIDSVIDAASIAESPWNKREVSRNASQETTQAGRIAVAQGLIDERAAGYTFNFEIRETESFAYGRDFFWGDLITAQYRGIEATKKLIARAITVNAQGEMLRFEIADYVQQVMEADPALRETLAINRLGERVDRIEAQERPLNHATDNVSTPPTDAQLDAAFGTPAAVGAGFIGTVNDNGAGANFYFVASDGANWWHVAGTKAV